MKQQVGQTAVLSGSSPHCWVSASQRRIDFPLAVPAYFCSFEIFVGLCGGALD